MLRLAMLILIALSTLPLAGCQYICTDSRGEAYGRNWIPFGRRYRMCNQSHCNDANGAHIDQRCSCSKNCGCWGNGGSAKADDAATGCAGCGSDA